MRALSSGVAPAAGPGSWFKHAAPSPVLLGKSSKASLSGHRVLLQVEAYDVAKPVAKDVGLLYNLQTLAICLGFMAVGPALILVNNHIINELGFPYPAAVSSLGLISSSLITHLLAATGVVVIQQPTNARFMLRTVLPIATLSSSTIVMGNAVYLHLSVAFVQMLKAMTPVYILACMVVFRLEDPRLGLTLSVLVISLGTGLASVGELRFSLIGFLLQCSADLIEGLKLVLQDVLLRRRKLSPFELMFFVNPISSCLQLTYVAVREPEALSWRGDGRLVAQHPLMVLGACLMGFGVMILGYLVMQRTSSLVMKLLSIFRSNMLVIGSAALLPGNTVTKVQWAGYAVSMVGFLWYSRQKQAAAQPVAVEKSPTQEKPNKF